MVEAGRVELLQLQADEIRLKAVGGIYWLASALEVIEAGYGWVA